MRSLLADVKYGVRTLSKAPAFTLVAILSLALGIGPNTAIFSLVDGVLFQGWGLDDPEEIVDIYTLTSDGEYFFSRYSSFELIEEGTTDVFSEVANHSVFTGRIESTNGEAEMALGEMVTGNYFDVMGVNAFLGRTFLPEEDATPGTHPVLVLGYNYWTSRYGADPDIVGSEVRLNGRPYTVVGVGPESFNGRIAPAVATSFWVPFSMYPHLAPSKLGSGDLTITARLQPGVTPGQAIAAVETVAARLDAELQAQNPDRRSRFQLIGVSLADVKVHPGFDGILTQIAVLLFIAVALVLLVACVNLAGFLLSRAADRRKEMAVRVAMGAGRTAIIRQLLVESLLLATAGATVGLALGQLALRAVLAVEIPLPLPHDLDLGLDPALLLFTAGTALVAAVVFGLTPALEATRSPTAATLRDESGSSGGRKKVGARKALVAAQMALSTMLLFGAALFVRSLQAASDLNLGFSARDAAVVDVSTTANGYTVEERVAFIEELARRLESDGGITDVAFTGRMPLDLGVTNTSFDIPGIEPPPDQNRHYLEFAAVTPGYFETLGIEIFEGRAFEETDRAGAPDVVILSRAAADRYWPDGSAVGQTLFAGPDGSTPLTVVGVADNVKIWSLGEAPFPYMYRPYFQGLENSSFSVVARGTRPGGEIAATIRDEARAIDPDIFITDVGTIQDHLGYAYFLPRMAAGILSFVGLLALTLACLGLYGMVSYAVSRRTREMGIRIALGAERSRVIALVLKSGLVLVAAGAVAGLVGSIFVGRIADQFLYGAGALDPLAIIAAPLVLALVAATATYLPARRASRVDPVRALRAE